MAIAWVFFERVKHLLGWITVTGGTRGGAALCKQPLMAKPLSGLCCVCVCAWPCSCVCVCVRHLFSISTSPHTASPGAHLPNFSVICLLKPFLPFTESSVFVSVLLSKTEFTHPARFFLLQFLSGLLRCQQHPPPPSPLALSFFPLLCVPRSFSFLPLSSRLPPPLSEEIDWVIWLGASSARFLARGKERSGGDMTTCRNNNNIHNIGRVGKDGGSSGMEPALARQYLKYSLHINGMPQHLHFCLSLSVYLSVSLSPPHTHCSRLCRLLISNSAWSAGCRQTGVEREEAVFVFCCLLLLQSK